MLEERLLPKIVAHVSELTLERVHFGSLFAIPTRFSSLRKLYITHYVHEMLGVHEESIPVECQGSFPWKLASSIIS